MNIVLGFELLKLLPLPLRTYPLGDLVGLPVEYNQVPAHQVEARQVLTSLLGIENIFIHHIGRSLGILAGSSINSKNSDKLPGEEG